MTISAAHLQTIGVFALPELLTHHRHFYERQPAFYYLQQDLANGQGLNQDGFHLVPAFDYRRSGSYDERFWSKFRGGPKDLPIHFPYKFRFDRPAWRPDVPPNELEDYQVRVRGYFYPYGAICLRISEYIRPRTSLTSDAFLALVSAPLRDGSAARNREGVLGELKDRIMKAFVKQDTQLDHSMARYRIIHIDSERRMNPKKDWKEIAALVAFSRDPNHQSKHKLKSFRNLSADPKNEMVFFSEYAGLLYTPRLWSQTTPRGRRCFRNRVANIVELALIQSQLYSVYRTRISQVARDLPLKKNKPLSELLDAVRPVMAHDVIRALNSTLGFQELLPSSRRDCSQWKEWFACLSGLMFGDRDTEAKRLLELNEAYIALEQRSLERLEKALGALSKLPFSKIV